MIAIMKSLRALKAEGKRTMSNVVSIGSNAMTICINCTSHIQLEKDGPRKDIWYNQLCNNPQVARKETIDPVTGKKGFEGTTDLGELVLKDRKEPYCRDINDGKCKYFEQK